MIEITAKKKYGEEVVLDVEKLCLTEGKCYVLIGANGSGKSTLLKILGNQLNAEVEQNINNKAYTVGYMPQNSYAFSMSVKKNILLPCSFKERRKGYGRMWYLASALDLLPYMRKNATKLSGGETQRMVLARTLMVNCNVLLLDEPTSALDVEQSKAVIELLKKELREKGMTLIVATHSLKQAELLADEVIFLSKGKVAEQGEPKGLLNNPKTQELQSFISFNA